MAPRNKEKITVQPRTEISRAAMAVLPSVKGTIDTGLGAVKATRGEVVRQLSVLGSSQVPTNNFDVASMATTQSGSDVGLLKLLDREDSLDNYRAMVTTLRGQGIHETAEVLRKMVSANMLGEMESGDSEAWYKQIGIKLRSRAKKDSVLNELGISGELLAVPEIRSALQTSLWFAEAALLADSMVKRAEKNLKDIDERNSDEAKKAAKISSSAVQNIIVRDTSWTDLQAAVAEAEREALLMIGNDPGHIGSEKFVRAADILKRRAEVTKIHTKAVRDLIDDGAKMTTLLDGVGDDEDLREAFLLMQNEASRLFLTCLRGVSIPLTSIKMALVGGVTLKLAMANGSLRDEVKILRQKNHEFIRREIVMLDKINNDSEGVDGKKVIDVKSN